MRKKLVRIGNGVALFIDKPLRRLMELTPSLEVEVQFDGTRLIVETALPDISPSTVPGHERLPLAMILDAGRVARVLVHQFGFPQPHLERLYPGCTRVVRYIVWADDVDHLRKADARESAVVRRMDGCCEQLTNGRSWAEAVATALIIAPLLPGSGLNSV